MAFSTYYTSAVSIDGNNYLRFRFEGERIGNTVTIKNIYLNPRWAVDSLATGWNFQLKVNGVVQKQEVKANFTAGGYSNEYSDAAILWSGPYSFTVTYSSNAVITLGIPSMYYNGTTVGDKFSSYTFGPVENPNSAPPTPTISCSTNPLNGNYYGESSVVVSLSAVTDPNGDSVSYRIYGQYKVPGGSFVNWNGGDDNLVSTDRSRTVNISGFARGTQFRFWGYAKDSKDAWSGKSNVIENIYRNRVPGTPSLSCSNTVLNNKYIGEGTIDVQLSAVSDPDGHGIDYAIYGQYNSGSGWNNIGGGDGLLSNSRNASVNITGYSRGTQFQFWGYSFDSLGAWSGKSNVISNIYRNKQPNAPTVSCSNTVVNGKYIAESSISVSINNPGDPDGGTVSYAIYGQYYNGSSWVGLGSGGSNLLTSSNSATVTITSHSRGTQYKFWAYSTDNFGVSSASSNVLSNVYRNRVGSVSGIGPASKVITENTIPLTWNATTDPDGQSVTYSIYLSKDGGTYTKLATQSGTSYSYNIASDPKGTKYKFKISANDGMADTAQVESPLYRKNFAPVRILPNATCKVFQNNPRLIISKVKLSDVYICVSYNSKTYTSKNNASMFTTKSVDSNGETVYVFTCTGLSQGANTITVYNSDGTFNSTSFTFTVTVENIDNSILENVVKVGGINTIKTKCNELRTSYALGNSTFDSLTSGTTSINYSHISQIRTAIDDIRNKINAYDSNTKTQTWSSASKGSIIKKSEFEQLISSLKNV